MIQRRSVFLIFGALALILAVMACGLGTQPEAAAPVITAPAEGEETVGEPAQAQPTQLILIPTSLPPSINSRKTPTPHIEMPPDGVLPTQPAVQSVQPAIPESRRLTLEFPPVVRAGDSARIRLQLEVDDRGNITPTAVVEGNVVTGEVVEIPNLYETYKVTAEARLDIAGIEVQPQGSISEPLLPGETVTFYWSVRPNNAGNYEGTVWLHLRFIPKEGGEVTRIPVSAQFLEIEARSFLGIMSGGAARGFGVVGSVLGSVLGFPFVDDLAKWAWRKVKSK